MVVIGGFCLGGVLRAVSVDCVGGVWMCRFECQSVYVPAQNEQTQQVTVSPQYPLGVGQLMTYHFN
jgi:hypothetical protein